MSPVVNWPRVVVDSFPRVSGDEPAVGNPQLRLYGFSPRERG